MRRYDVIVAGLGAFGSALASELAGRGASVAGFDRWRPPHTLGSSHGGSRIIRKVYFEDPLYVPLLERAYRAWGELEEASGTKLLERTGSLSLGAAGGELFRGAEQSAELHRLACEVLDAGQVMARFPTFRVPEGTVAAYDPEAGVLRPEAAIQAQLNLARRRGATLCFGEPLAGWRATADGVEVETPLRTVGGDRLIVAAGAWAEEMAAAAGTPLPESFAIERAVQHWFWPVGGAEKRFEVGRHPAFVWELPNGLIWYGLPDLEGGLKAALHYAGERVARLGEVRRGVEAADVEEVERLVRRFLPEALGEYRRSKVCLYTVSADTRFRIDRLPDAERILVVSACSGHGFKFAPAIAELVAQEVLEGVRSPELAPFGWRPAAVG